VFESTKWNHYLRQLYQGQVTSIKKVKLSLKQALEAHRVVTSRGSDIFYKIGSQMTVRLSALGPAVLYPQEDSWYSFLSEAESTPRAIVRLEGLGHLKKSNDFIGKRTRDLPACSIVPQLITLPSAPNPLVSRSAQDGANFTQCLPSYFHNCSTDGRSGCRRMERQRQ
jgi:hypothetical protein